MFFKGMTVVVGMMLWCGIAMAQDAKAPATNDTGYTPSRFELSVRSAFLSLDAKTSLVREFSGEKLALADELGMDSVTNPEIRLRWRFAEHHSLTAAYLGFDESGEKFFARPFILDNRLTAAFGTLKSNISLDYYRIGWRWEIAGRNSDKFDLETVLDAAIFDLDASYERYQFLNPFFPSNADSIGGTAGIPIIGLRAEFRPTNYLAFNAELAGITAGSYGHMIDFELGAKLILGQHFTVEGGYRYIGVHGEFDSDNNNGNPNQWGLVGLLAPATFNQDDEDTADIDLSGPYLSVGIRF